MGRKESNQTNKSTQEDLSWHNWKIVKNQIKQMAPVKSKFYLMN